MTSPTVRYLDPATYPALRDGVRRTPVRFARGRSLYEVGAAATMAYIVRAIEN